MSFEAVGLARKARPQFESLEARVVPANLAPTIAQPINAVVDAATLTAQLSVLGADDGGEQNLKYNWNVSPHTYVSGAPLPQVTYSPGLDGERATVRFPSPGLYYVNATIYDAQNAVVRERLTLPVGVSYVAPTVAQPAKALLNSDQTKVALSVLGADDGGESNLYYTWTIRPAASSPPGTPFPTITTFSGPDGNLASANISAPGSYIATVTIRDKVYLTTMSEVTVTVAAIRQPLSVSRTTLTMNVGTSFDFDAVYRDQFGNPMASPQSATVWSIVSGPGAIDPAGKFTAPAVRGVTVIKAVADGATAYTTVVTRDPGTVPPRSSRTVGEQKVLVVQWVFADQYPSGPDGRGNIPIDYTRAEEIGRNLDSWFRQQSFSKTGLSFTYVPVMVRMDITAAEFSSFKGNFTQEILQKVQRLDSSFNQANFDRIWIGPDLPNMPSTGLAAGNYFWLPFAVPYASHELAHTFGLPHPTEDEDIGVDITAPSKLQLGWITPTDPLGFRVKTYTDFTTGGITRLYDLNSTLAAPDGDRSVRVGNYTLSYSSFRGNRDLIIHEGPLNRLDTTPGSNPETGGWGGQDWTDGGVAVGRSYTLPATVSGKYVRLTVLGLTPAAGGKPAGMDVKVEFLTAPPANQPPVAVADSAATPSGEPVTVDVVRNDTDPEYQPRTLAAVGTAAHGTVAIVGGKAVYAPAAGYVGTDAFTYTVSDGKGGTGTGTVAVRVGGAATPVPNGGFETPGLGTGYYAYTPAGATWAFAGGGGVAANGSPLSGLVAAPAGNQFAFLQGTSRMTQSVPLAAGTHWIDFRASQRGSHNNGGQTVRVLVNGQSVGTFTPDRYSFGSYATASFTVPAGTHVVTFEGLNPFGGDNTALIDSVRVVTAGGTAPPANRSPVAVADAAATAEGSPVTVNVLANDTDPDGDLLSVVAVGVPLNGTVVVAAGKAVYTPRAGYAGSDSFSYTVSDGKGGTATGSVYVTVNAASAAGLADGGFESPAVGVGQHRHNPSGSAWSFTGPTGLAGNASAFTSGNPAAPQGGQVAYLQGAGGTVSQSVALAAGTYRVDFRAAQRGLYNNGGQTIRVLVNGQPVGTFTPAGAAYAAYATATFVVPAGTHAVTFEGLNPKGGDNTAFVDDVRVNLVAAAPATTLSGAVAADNSVEVYLNGVKVATGSDWTLASILSNLTLQAGKNVLAVRAVDAGGVSGLIADLTVGGVRVGSSSNWKVAKAPPAGWNAVGYDDAGWAAATEYGAYGAGPWGKNVRGLAADTAAKWIWTADNTNDNEAFFRLTFTA